MSNLVKLPNVLEAHDHSDIQILIVLHHAEVCLTTVSHTIIQLVIRDPFRGLDLLVVVYFSVLLLVCIQLLRFLFHQVPQVCALDGKAIHLL